MLEYTTNMWDPLHKKRSRIERGKEILDLQFFCFDKQILYILIFMIKSPNLFILVYTYIYIY